MIIELHNVAQRRTRSKSPNKLLKEKYEKVVAKVYRNKNASIYSPCVNSGSWSGTSS